MNMMLAKTEIVPYVGELEMKVDRLREILAPVGLDRSAVEAAVVARRTTAQAETEAKAELHSLRRRYPAPSNGYGEHSEVQAAVAKLARAEASQTQARAAFSRAKEKRAKIFMETVMPQIEQAAPILLEVAKLLNDAINPLRELYSTAGDLPLPRLLTVAPTLSEATRVFTAALNAATAPNPPVRDDDDES